MSDNKCFCHFTDKETGESYEVKDATARRSLEDKVDKVEGKGLSTNDYTTEEKEKLAGLSNYDDTELREKIPTKTSQLNNDSGFITGYTETDPTVPSHVKSITQTDISNWDNKADKSSIPTKTSQLTNDSGFVTSSSIPTKTSQLTNDSGFVTSSGTVAQANNATKLAGSERYLGGHDTRNKVMIVGNDGVVEVGKYMDFHTTYEEDYAVRVTCPDGVTGVGVNLPSKNGTLAVTSDIPSSADFVKTSGGQEIDGYKKFLQDLQVGSSLTLLNSPNGGIEIGRRDGTTSTPYIDFHTDGNAINVTDYNVRMMASGGTKGVNGSGNLNISAGNLTHNSKELLTYEASSSSTTGYIKLPKTNIMICWGFYSGGGNKTITLPNGVAYANSTYTIATACGYKESTSNGYGQYTNQTTTGFKLIGGANDTSDCWITVGRYQ